MCLRVRDRKRCECVWELDIDIEREGVGVSGRDKEGLSEIVCMWEETDEATE